MRISREQVLTVIVFMAIVIGGAKATSWLIDESFAYQDKTRENHLEYLQRLEDY